MIDLGENDARLVEESPTRVGQLDPARLAPEQLHVELAFERANLLAERRLLDAKPRGGARDVGLLGHGNEVTQVPHFHDPYLTDMNITHSIYWIDWRRRAMLGLFPPLVWRGARCKGMECRQRSAC